MTATKFEKLKPIELARVYRANGLVEKSDDWGPDLWLLVASKLDLTLEVPALRETAVLQTMKHRFINYVVSRLVVGGCSAIADVLRNSDARQEPLQQIVEDLLDIDEDSRDRIVWYLDRICPRILSKANELSKIQINSIRKFAVQEGHRCYLCGRFLHTDALPYGQDEWHDIEKVREKRKFEIEHIWNQARGGQKNIHNLAASCNECNKQKRELLSPADIALESFIGRPNKEKSVQAFLSKEIRFALIWYQHGQCATCNKPFYELEGETVVVALREQKQPYHFFNMMICCLTCDTQKQLSGVKIREPL